VPFDFHSTNTVPGNLLQPWQWYCHPPLLEETFMRKIWIVTLLLSGRLLLAQDSHPATSDLATKDSKGQATLQGCVSRSSGDYTLIKQNPAMTYELQGSRKIKLRHYLGQRVEVTGSESPTMSSSSDAMNRTGSAAPVTLTITSIRTIDKDCRIR
jgi:hypothetical protein